MIVTRAGEGDSGFVEEVTFDNGLVLSSDFRPDCCTINILDFGQLHVGRKFPTMTGEQFLAAIVRKDDGFIIKDSLNVPAWVQARSIQNGYYSANVSLVVTYGGITLGGAQDYEHDFEGEVE